MKALIAFTILLLSASCFELSDSITEDEMTELYDALTAEPEVSEFARGQWEVLGMPGIVYGPKKGPATDTDKHVKDIACIKKGIKSLAAAAALIKNGLSHPKAGAVTSSTVGPEEHHKYVCSYAYVKKAGYGHTVWCSKRDRFGEHTRMYKYKQGCFFTGGYMM